MQTQLRAWDTARATGIPVPSRADPLSPQREHVAKGAARLYSPTPHLHDDSTGTAQRGAPIEDQGGLPPPTERGSTSNWTTTATHPDEDTWP